MAFTQSFTAQHEQGHIRSANADYATARTGGTIIKQSTGLDNFFVGQSLSAGTYYVWEGLFEFDTSTLPDDATITAATLYLTIQADSTTTDFDIEVRVKDWGVSLDNGDWVSGADLSALPLAASLSTAGLSGEFGIAFSDTSQIAKTGRTKLQLSSSRHRVGNTPSGDEYLSLWTTTKNAGTEPRLSVTYTSASKTEGQHGPNHALISSAASSTPYDDNNWDYPLLRALGKADYFAGIYSSSFDTNDYSYLSYMRGFEFSVGAEDTIVGVVVEMESYYVTNTFAVASIKLTDADGAVQGDDRYADDGNCTSTDKATPDVLTFGGATETWGATLTPAIVNDPDFGVKFSVQAKGNDCDAYVTNIRMTIYVEAEEEPPAATTFMVPRWPGVW